VRLISDVDFSWVAENLMFTCDIHRKGFLHNKFSGALFRGVMAAAAAADGKRERERRKGILSQRAERRGKGFSIIGALRNTRCMM